MNLEQLNDRQKEAVLYNEGPLLINAGAGAGKTKTLTTKIAFLIEEKNVNPRNILAITAKIMTMGIIRISLIRLNIMFLGI